MCNCESRYDSEGVERANERVGEVRQDLRVPRTVAIVCENKPNQELPADIAVRSSRFVYPHRLWMAAIRSWAEAEGNAEDM